MGVDMCCLVCLICIKGVPNGVIVYEFSGKFDILVLFAKVQVWLGFNGMDFVKDVFCV